MMSSHLLTFVLCLLVSSFSAPSAVAATSSDLHVLRIIRGGLSTADTVDLAVDRAGDVYATDWTRVVKFSGKTG